MPAKVWQVDCQTALAELPSLRVVGTDHADALLAATIFQVVLQVLHLDRQFKLALCAIGGLSAVVLEILGGSAATC